MNANFELAYLTGGDEVFGPDSAAPRSTPTPARAIVEECPNVGKLLQNIDFTLAMENEIMGAILDDGDGSRRRRRGLARRPTRRSLDAWLEGVTTLDGGDGAGGGAAARSGL